MDNLCAHAVIRQPAEVIDIDIAIVETEQYSVHMNIRQRAEAFSRYVGLELKGKIISQQFTAKAVAEAIGRQPAAFNRWLNGKVEMPITVLCAACEYIDVEPATIVETAYSRLAVEHGERDGRIYPSEEWGSTANGGEIVIGVPDVPNQDEYDLVANESIDETYDVPDSDFDNA